MHKSKGIKLIMSGLMLCCSVVCITTVCVTYGAVKSEKGRICKGVSIGSVSVEGMTKKEAKKAVNTYVDTLLSRKVVVNVAKNIVETNLVELDYACETNDYIEQALNIGKTGNVVKRYKDLTDAQNGKLAFDLTFTVDEAKIKAFVEEKCEQYTQKAINATVKRENRAFVYTKEKAGQKVDVNETIQKMKTIILENVDDEVLTIDAVVVKDIPAFNRESVTKCKDKIGTYATNYNAGVEKRSKNLANAADLIDGTVVYPGETFSAYETIAPLDETNGYHPAPSYANGEVVDSIGGGVCQVSTTLYNAVLRAELEIVERSPHSMVVSYVEPSMDAAIAGTYKDFKFKNNTDSPIYLMGGAHGGVLYFTVYGHEVRSPNRKIEFETEILEEIEPGPDKVTKDPTKPTTYVKETQAKHIGYKARLWKMITEDGETKKMQINSSSYAATPRYVVQGTKKEKEKSKVTKETKKPKKTESPSGG